jgi:hypothetical protein
MNIIGCYLTGGKDRQPQTHFIGDGGIERLLSRLSVDGPPIEKLREATYAEIFGKGTQFAFPCWEPEFMKLVALRFEGPHQDEVRRIAACCALGKPYSPDLNGGMGDHATLKPDKPIKPMPPAGAPLDEPAIEEPEPVAVGADRPALKRHNRK